MYKDFKTLKKGDQFVESEYGTSILLTVTTKPKLERPDYLTFKAKITKLSNDKRIGEVVNYGFQYPSGAYNPTIYEPGFYFPDFLPKPSRSVRRSR